MLPFHSPSSLECFCGQTYSDLEDLEEHRIARGHFASHRCGIYCKHSRVSPSRSRTYSCGNCSKTCENLDILYNHHIATGHCFCSECDVHFDSQNALTSHKETEIHASEFKCCDCNIFFHDVHALVAHMASRAHRKPLKPMPLKTTKISRATKDNKGGSATSHDCSACHKGFKTAQSLEQHCQSVRHKPLSNLSCPVRKCVQKNFLSPSALLHHLESGACRSGLNRDEIYRIVRLHDEDGAIHDRRALTPLASPVFPTDSPSLSSEVWIISAETSSEWSLLTPSSSEDRIKHSLDRWSLLGNSRVLSERSSTLDTTAAATPYCPMCPKKRKRFANMQALQQHFNSPVHSAKVFHCPTILVSAPPSRKGKRTKQEKHFSTLSGLSQHLESGACRGGKGTFLLCIAIVQERLKLMGFGGMRVLLSSNMT